MNSNTESYDTESYDTESFDIPDMIPPLFAAFPIIVEFILPSEIGEIPLNCNSDVDGSFCTFAKKNTGMDISIILEIS